MLKIENQQVILLNVELNIKSSKIYVHFYARGSQTDRQTAGLMNVLPLQLYHEFATILVPCAHSMTLLHLAIVFTLVKVFFICF